MMKIESWYRENWESNLQGRYITLEKILPLLNTYSKKFEISFDGRSEQNREIPLVKIGNGKKVILAWSQMHGNESTTTKALFDLFKFLSDQSIYENEIAMFLNRYTLVVLPILNPDGSELYTRENANSIDLNRDFQTLSQRESIYLISLFESLKPSLCLNMHDQRTIYGLENGNPATISFLSPSADKERSMTPARKSAMEGIVRMNTMLQEIIPGQVGRYDDGFNAACVGDAFQMKGVPTILFEAGHYQKDYQREKTREYIFYSLLTLFGILNIQERGTDYKEYFKIPENKNNFRDVVLRNAILPTFDKPVDVSIQYVEKLKNNKIIFVPFVDQIISSSELLGHRENDLNITKILTNTGETLTVGREVPKIFDKTENSIFIFE